MSESTAPVDMEVLRSATDGTAEDLQSLVKLFREQMAEYIRSLQAAVEQGDPNAIQKAAHKAAGSSSICGMAVLSESLRRLQYLKQEELNQAPSLFADVTKEFGKVTEFLDVQFPR